MVFSSPEFLFAFLPLTLIIYYAVPRSKIKIRNLVLLALSLIFYGWGEPRYVLLMAITILADYFFGRMVQASFGNRTKARRWVLAAVIFNLGILGYFKYARFLVSSLSLIPGLAFLPLPRVKLPVGISFYTFQALSYVIDVYRGEVRAQRDPLAFGTYVTLFPQLVAGPIVRYRDIDGMLTARRESRAMMAQGIRTFVLGLGKKLIFANAAGAVWETLRAIPQTEQSLLGSWMGLAFYTFQIYFDFSAYSDMAIGLGRMFGFSFLENFNYPYVAQSITDFWRRWHISLSAWFREYLYLPLGGSRCKEAWKNYRNLFAVWLCTGIWHGASWNYILWGMYYFLLLTVERILSKRISWRPPRILRHGFTMLAVMLGWWLFVFEDLGAGVTYLFAMLGMGGGGWLGKTALFDLLRHLVFLSILCIAATPLPKTAFTRLYHASLRVRALALIGTALVMVLAVAYMISSSYNPFLYFIF